MVAASSTPDATTGQKHNETDTTSTPSSSSSSNNPPDLSSEEKSLIIPITTSKQTPAPFIEIFPEELPSVPPQTLIQVLKDEDAPLNTWCDASLLYVQKRRDKEGSELLSAACELEPQMGCTKDVRVRTLSSAGIVHLTQADRFSGSGGGASGGSGGDGGSGGSATSLLSSGNWNGEGLTPQQRAAADRNEELRSMADNWFTRATKVDQFFPMTWIGRGMLNLSVGRVDQARFFFETTLRQCGQVLPALLGMAAVRFKEGQYGEAQDLYGRAMKLFPQKSGAAARVGFGLACYKMGQVDRAKAAFRRAHVLDNENVEAMVGLAILEMASLDENARDFRSRTENAIRMMSMANLIDHSNAMVQNHLANHYFWKWSPAVPGSCVVKAEQGSCVMRASMVVNLDVGQRVRVGGTFETYVVDFEEEEDGAGDGNDDKTFKVRDPWKGPSEDGLKLWKKDYDRVIALAKGAYSSTTIKEIQAESLFLLARVYHVQDQMETANKFYDRSISLAPDLSPARFGLAQTLIWDEKYEEAAAHLRLVLGTSSSATDALAALGLLEVKVGGGGGGNGKDRKEAFSYLKKAIDFDPLNPDLVLLEALALQQQEVDYPQSLVRYRKAVQLMESQGKPVPYEVLTNIGVLCHETKKHEEALEFYVRALKTLDKDETTGQATLDAEDTDQIRHADNSMFWSYANAGVFIITVSDGPSSELIMVDESGSPSMIPGALKVGDHIRLGDTFETEVAALLPGTDDNGNKSKIRIVECYFPPPQEEEENQADSESTPPPKPTPLYAKRSNKRLHNPPSISIAFNLARLHESSGRIIPSVELHKAIVSRHPSYVNSYLRLACISRDCGSLKDCSEWLKSACAVAPGNPEVLTLVGNLHLSLCDWAPAQSVFDQLLAQKVGMVEAYSMLSLGNIYFNNLKTPKKYSKHLQYAADFYKRILNRDKANAYAANGLGTVLAEKGELFKAKEVFNRVREVSGDTLPDTLLNLGHIYLAQKKHPEALQMYQSYMSRTKKTGAPITSKSQDDDDAEVLMYIAFAYFDWARQTEAFNDARASAADERYKQCVQYLEQAMKKSKKENVLIRYNWCMAKLQAANCVLQKLTRNIRRTAAEVQEALKGLEDSLPVVQTILQWKAEGKKVPIGTSMLNDFVGHCKANIESAKSHLKEELKKEAEAKEMRELQRIEALTQRKEREMEELVKKEKRAREMERRDYKARLKMDKVTSLVMGWEHDSEAKRQSEEKKAAKKAKKALAEQHIPQTINDDENSIDDEVPNHPGASRFEDTDEEDGGQGKAAKQPDANNDPVVEEVVVPPTQTQEDLFGESSDDDSDEELVKGAGQKRGADDDEDDDDESEEGQATKRRKVDDDDDDD